MAGPITYKSRLHEMTQTTPTCLWNDSAAIAELTYCIEHGGVGATCNPVIVLEVLKKEMHLWKSRISGLIDEMPTATEHQIAWKLVEARRLQPRFVDMSSQAVQSAAPPVHHEELSWKS